jgi:uncharacterized protein YjbI with pentapeptide repeats
MLLKSSAKALLPLVHPTKDYSNKPLRGRNFKGEDLKGGNFSGADIRGACFSKAQLQGADFTGAISGVRKRWLIAKLIVAFVLSVAFNVISILINILVVASLSNQGAFRGYPGLSIVVYALLIFTYWTVARQGFTVQSLSRITVASAVSVASILSVSISFFSEFASGTPFVCIAIISFLVAFLGSIMVSVAIANTFIGAGVAVMAFMTAIITAITVTGGTTGDTLSPFEMGIAIMHVAAPFLILSSYASWRIYQDDKKFALVRNFSIFFGAIGGTSFRGADLSNAIFTNAQLKNTNFNSLKDRRTRLTNVHWKNSRKLERARLGKSILADQKVLKLLATGDGTNQNYTGLNFDGANLEAAKLNGANFTNANLNNTSLRGADLQYAILTEAQVLGSDLRNTYLTGACLENWNIDASTKLDDIECRYIYLLAEPNQNGTRERRPHDPDATFSPGDFSNLYQKVVNTVEILLKDGYRNAAAYSAALQTLMATNPKLTSDSLQSIKRVGQHDAQITLNVPPETDKADLEKQFQRTYEENRQLRGKIDELQALRAADLKDIALSLTQQKPQVTIQTNQINGDNTMTEQNNQAISAGSGSNINTGNQTGNTIAFNLGTISGNLTLTLTQLQSSNQPPSIALADHLTQLKTAIESDTALPDTDKAETLQKVDDLAKAGTAPEDIRRHGAAKSAIDFLKGTITALPKATAFAEACHKLLPLISTALKGLGLPF